MREENAIEVKDLKKQFKVYYDKGSQLKEKMLFWKRNRYEHRQVLSGRTDGTQWLWKEYHLKAADEDHLSDLRYCGDAGKGFQSDRAWSRISPGYERKTEYLYECGNFRPFQTGDRRET